VFFLSTLCQSMKPGRKVLEAVPVVGPLSTIRSKAFKFLLLSTKDCTVRIQ
jgi:hypothetical protein